MQDRGKGISGWWNSEPKPPTNSTLSLPTPSWHLCLLSPIKTHPPLTLSLSTSHPPTHFKFRPRHLRVLHFWGWQNFLSHQGERSTTHHTRLHRSAQDNRFSLFSFFSL
ncbi:hypothetical protein AMTRI_Chr03g138540 [Amborella trichopoda]